MEVELQIPVTLRLWGNRPARPHLLVGDIQIDRYLLKNPDDTLVPVGDRILDLVAREAIKLLSRNFNLKLDPDPIPFQNPLRRDIPDDPFPLRTGKIHQPTPGLKLPQRVRLFPSLEYNKSPPGPGLETSSSTFAKALAEIFDLPTEIRALREEMRQRLDRMEADS